MPIHLPVRHSVALAVCVSLLMLGATAAGASPADPDSSFGGGKVTTDFGGGRIDEASGVAVQPDGKTVAVGETDTVDAQGNVVTAAFALARYNNDGSLDQSFGTGGRVTTSFGSGLAAAAGLAIQADGKIVVAGTTAASLQSAGDLALARYTTAGGLDTSFGNGGQVIADLGGDDAGNAAALQADGKIVVAGSTGQAAQPDSSNFGVARFTPTGALDSTFGSGGKVVTDVAGFADDGTAVTLGPGGTIVVGGSAVTASGGTAEFSLARYLPDGTLDPSFGTGGKVTDPNGSSGWDESIGGLATQPDGKIVAAGSIETFDADTGDLSSSGLVVLRYTSTGALDATFARQGRQTLVSAQDFWFLNGVALQTDGRIVVAGESASRTDAAKDDFLLARLNPDGTMDDTNFPGRDSGTAFHITDFGGDDHANAVALRPDGMIVLAGATSATGNGDFALARYQGGNPAPPPNPALIVGPGPGSPPLVRTFDAAGHSLRDFMPYPAGFTGGVRVARGDVDPSSPGDEIVTGAGSGGGPDVRVFSADGTRLLAAFFPYDAAFHGGVDVAVAKLGTGAAEIITGPGPGGGPNVKVFTGTGAQLASFFAYDAGFAGGVHVAGGMGTGGTPQIVTGPGPGGGPNVKTFSPTGAPGLSFFAYDAGFAGGVFVSAGDIDQRPGDEIVTGPGSGGGPHVREFSGATPIDGFFAYDAGFSGGVRVAVLPQVGIFTGPGPGGGPNVKVFNPQKQMVGSWFPYDGSFSGGVFVAGGAG